MSVHREAELLPRTLASLREAVAFAEACGLHTELVIALDRGDEATRSVLRRMNRTTFLDVRVIEVDHGSLGLTRNAAIAMARGEWIITADADDLVSFNYVAALVECARAAGPLAVTVPEFLLAFGGKHHIAQFFDLKVVTPLALFADHPYVSRICFHRSLAAELSFADTSLRTSPYAYEDWHFNCEAVALGRTFLAAPGAMLFYRIRSDGMLHSSTGRDIPPSRLFSPPVFRRICAPFAERLAQEGDWRAAMPRRGAALLEDPAACEMIAAANRHEPMIKPGAIAAGGSVTYLHADLAPALAYLRICDIVGEREFDEVFLLPYLTRGGADRYLLDVMAEIARLDPSRRFLLLLGHRREAHYWLDQLPPNALHLDMPALCPGLTAEQMDLVCFRLLQGCARGARLHIKPSDFAQRFFSRYHASLPGHRAVFYRFSEPKEMLGPLTINDGFLFGFVSEHAKVLATIVSDNEATVAQDRRRIGAPAGKWQVLRSRLAPGPLPPFHAASRGRVLWLSRLDSEKRPGLLLAIAARLAEEAPEVAIAAHGAASLGQVDPAMFAAQPNFTWHGPFDSLADVRPEEHDVFLYTSAYDGIPVVLLEMAAAGLPIVAPDVGAIGEVVRDGETGLLLPMTGDDEADAARYVAAIRRLLAESELRRSLRAAAWGLVRRQHGAAAHAAGVRRIFEGG
ncbi:glycosyltransferase [Roseococcus sp. DSY-14]|uniref:glycosyltransferase n=1 Tax=Roseococcus sp. DSY-14 TaxID=3369650 RepID=UPI00387A9837